MDYDEKVKYLSSFLSLDAYIDTLIEEKEHWYERALKMNPTYSDMPKQKSTTDRTAYAIEKVVMCENEIDRMVDSLVERRRNITSAISGLNDLILERIVYMKYINGYSFEKIGEQIGYCTKQISRLHKKAIEKIELEKQKPTEA